MDLADGAASFDPEVGAVLDAQAEAVRQVAQVQVRHGVGVGLPVAFEGDPGAVVAAVRLGRGAFAGGVAVRVAPGGVFGKFAVCCRVLVAGPLRGLCRGRLVGVDQVEVVRLYGVQPGDGEVALVVHLHGGQAAVFMDQDAQIAGEFVHAQVREVRHRVLTEHAGLVRDHDAHVGVRFAFDAQHAHGVAQVGGQAHVDAQ